MFWIDLISIVLSWSFRIMPVMPRIFCHWPEGMRAARKHPSQTSTQRTWLWRAPRRKKPEKWRRGGDRHRCHRCLPLQSLQYTVTKCIQIIFARNIFACFVCGTRMYTATLHHSVTRWLVEVYFTWPRPTQCRRLLLRLRLAHKSHIREAACNMLQFTLVISLRLYI